MIKFLYKINKQYDQIPGNARFMTFMGMMVPAMLGQGIAATYEMSSLFIGCWIYLMLMLLIRMAFIHGWLDSGKVDSE